MAAVELPADLPLSASPADAIHLQHVLRERFRIEASLQRPYMASCSTTWPEARAYAWGFLRKRR